MPFDPARHHRRSTRLQGYDYAEAGIYFVTLCTVDRECLFGEIIGESMQPSRAGDIVQEVWLRSPTLRSEIALDAMVIMPNHLHGIVIIQTVGATGRSPLQPVPGPAKRSLGALIAGFKAATTKRINAWRGTPGSPVWQRNYYDRIIRDEDELWRIREYIANNPAQWAVDRENPVVVARRAPSRPGT